MRLALLLPALLAVTAQAFAYPQILPADVVPTADTGAVYPIGGMAAIDGDVALVVPAFPYPAEAPGPLRAIFMARDAGGTWSETGIVTLNAVVHTLGQASMAVKGDVAVIQVVTDSTPRRVRSIIMERSPTGDWAIAQTISTGVFLGVISPTSCVAIDSGDILLRDHAAGRVRVFQRPTPTGAWVEGTPLLDLPPYFFGAVEMSVKDGLAVGLDGVAYSVHERDVTGTWVPTDVITLPPNVPFNLPRFPYSAATDGEFIAISLLNDPGSAQGRLYIVGRTDPAQPDLWSVIASFDNRSLGGDYRFASPRDFDDLHFSHGILTLSVEGACGTEDSARNPITIQRPPGSSTWVVDAPHCALPLGGAASSRALAFDGTTLIVGSSTARSQGTGPGGAVAYVDVPSLAVDCDGNGLRDLDEIAQPGNGDRNSNGILDICETIGRRFCTDVIPNSTGNRAYLTIMGARGVGQTPLVLRARGAPPGMPCVVISSPFGANLPGAGGSTGRLCISGLSFGRFTGQASAIGTTGDYFALIDRNAIPIAGGFTSIAPGTYWYFQAWFADGSMTSNFTDAVYLRFE